MDCGDLPLYIFGVGVAFGEGVGFAVVVSDVVEFVIVA